MCEYGYVFMGVWVWVCMYVWVCGYGCVSVGVWVWVCGYEFVCVGMGV